MTKYDELPPEQQTLQALVLPEREAAELERSVPRAIQRQVHDYFQQRFVNRVERLPDRHVTAAAYEARIPLADLEDCRRWVDSWLDDPDFMRSLLARSYQTIRCGSDAEWDLRTVSKRCFLYWAEHEVNRRDQEDVPIWKQSAAFMNYQEASAAAGEDMKQMRRMMIARDAISASPGESFTISNRGREYVQIRGAGDRPGGTGFVDARACHPAPKKN